MAHGESDRMTITKQRPNRKELICKRNYGVPLVSSFAQANALAKLLIEKGIITQQEFSAKILEERATYQAMLKPTSH